MNKRDNIFILGKSKSLNLKKKLTEINIKEIKFIQNQEIFLNNRNESSIKSSKKNFKIKNSNHLSFLFEFLLFIMIINISYSESNLRKLTLKNEIILTVKELSINQLFISEYIRLPDEIIINGENKNVSTNYNLINSNNIIKLRWNSPINTSKNMFYNLNSVISVDFSNFDSSQITDMTGMFYGCKNLKSVNFSSFITSLVTSMKDTFNGCSSLVSLDLSSFKTDKLQTMEGMFRNAESLISLDLSNFNISLANSFEYTFFECKSLIFLNLNSFEENGSVKVFNMFSNDTKDLIYCINNDKNREISKALLDIQNIQNQEGHFHDGSHQDELRSKNNNCSNVCFSNTAKIIIEKKKCIDKCENDDIFKYEYKNICFNHTILETNGITEENQITYSEIMMETEINDNTQKEMFEEVESMEKIEKSQSESSENNIILENFSVEDFFKQSIDIEIINVDSAIKDEIIKSIKENLMKGNLDILLVNVTSEEKQDLIATDKNTIYQITTSDNQKNKEYTNISTINLGECEERLKYIYGIDKNLSLLIFKIDYFNSGLKIPVIEYEIYHPLNKSQLDLKYCEDILVTFDIPVSIDESSEYKYDPSSEYYNDECLSYTTENGTDILLDDRRNEYIDNNLSLCETNCKYKGYNEDTKKSFLPM